MGEETVLSVVIKFFKLARVLTFTPPLTMSEKTDKKIVTFEDLQAHAKKESLYILLHNKGVSHRSISCLEP